MNSRVFPILSACSLALCLAACAPAPQTSTRPEVVSENLAEVKTPILRSAYFDRKWGAPNAAVMSDGTYQLRYRQGTTLNFVIIRSLVKLEPAPATPPDWEEAYDDPEGTTPAPAPHKQSWKHTTIVGKTVKWYQEDGGSGADFPGYRTEDFSLTSPDGRTGFYRISVCSDEERKAADWIHRVGW